MSLSRPYWVRIVAFSLLNLITPNPGRAAPLPASYPLPNAPTIAADPIPQDPAQNQDPRTEQLGARLRESLGKLRAQAQGANAPTSSQATAIAKLRAQVGDKLHIHGLELNGTPRHIRGGVLEQAATTGQTRQQRDARTARAFLNHQRELLRLDRPDQETSLQSHQEDNLGRRHLRYTQTYRGLKVWPAELIVHLDPDGNVDALDGAFVPTPRRTQTQPVLNADAAIARARQQVPDAATVQPDPPELILYAPGEGPARLAWKLRLPVSALARWLVVIDAVNGATLKVYNEVAEQGVTGSGVDLQGVTRPLNLWQQGGFFYLQDTSKAMYNPSSTPPTTVRGGILVFDAAHRPGANPSGNINDIQLNYVTSTSPTQGWLRDAVSAAFNLSVTYDYFSKVLGRNSLDGQGGSLLSVVRYGQGFRNAFWNGQTMVFGDAEPYAAALDVVAHELAHGVTNHSANLQYVDQSGALNEAMSDIFGSGAEAYARGSTDWLMGDSLSRPLRSLKDPASMILCCGRHYPAKMSEFILSTDTFLNNFANRDNGGVHINSSIINRAFYLLAEGLNGAIGLQNAQKIFYRALTVHLVARSQFTDARNAALAAAEELFGQNSTPVAKVAEAFDAVEIFAATNSPTPTPLPTVNASDSTLCAYSPDGTTFYLCRRETALGDPQDGIYFSNQPIRWLKRPAVSGDGTVAVVVSHTNDICVFATDGNFTECLGYADQVYSVAMSPDGNRYAFVFLDSFGRPENTIRVVDVNADNTKVLTLKGTSEDGQPADIGYADAMTFSADGRYLVYDALNTLTLSDQSKIEVWSIYALDTTTDHFLTLFPPTEGWDIEFPAMGHSHTHWLTFEAYDQTQNQTTVYATNLDTGDLNTITTVADGFFAEPVFNGDDQAVIYSQGDSQTTTGTSLYRQNLNPGQPTPKGAASLWLSDADTGVIYRRGAYQGATHYDLALGLNGQGMVGSAPSGIACGGGGSCAAAYPQDSTVVLSAQPNSGETFQGWSGGCDAVAGPICTVYMTRDKQIAAAFSNQQPPDNSLPLPESDPASAFDALATWKGGSKWKCNSQRCVIKGKLLVRSQSQRSYPRSTVALYLSDDAILDADDIQIKTATVGKLTKRGKRVLSLNIKLPPGLPLQGLYLFAVADGGNATVERDEANNRAMTRLP